MQFICLVLFIFVELAVGQSDVKALLELKKGIESDLSGKVLVSWDSKSLVSNGCPRNWYGISCSEGLVTSIALNDMRLTGIFNFAAISGLKMLHNLSIPNNQLSGSISEELGLISALKYLDLSGNLFNGTMPPGLTNLKSLVFRNLSFNYMEGTIPSGFNSLEELNYLDLHSNGFSGDVLDLLAQEVAK